MDKDDKINDEIRKTENIMKNFSEKIEIINHYDSLINQLDIKIEELIEIYKEKQEIIGDLKCFKSKRSFQNEKFIFHRFFNLNELQQNEVKSKPDDLWSESTKVIDYLHQVRMQTLGELRKAQEDSLEYLKTNSSLFDKYNPQTEIDEMRSRCFGDKFYFQVLHKSDAWIFNLYTIVSDFYMSPSDIDLLQKMINAEEIDYSSMILDEKFILINLVIERFIENLNNSKFPNHLIKVSKLELSKFQNITVLYSVSGINLTCSSIDLSKINRLIVKGESKLDIIKLENLTALKLLEFNFSSLDRITLSNLNSLQHLNLFVTQMDKTIQEKLELYFPNIQRLALIGNLSYFKLDNLVNLKELYLSDKKLKEEFNLDLFKNLCKQLEELVLFKYDIDDERLAKLLNGHQFVKLRMFSIEYSKITRIENKLFDGFPMLNSLSIYNNKHLKTIDHYAFSNLKQLNYLDLHCNSIETLDKRHFSELVNLKYLDLSENQLENIEDNMFHNLKNLEKLDLSNNKLAKLTPKSFIGLDNLSELDIRYNKLRLFDLYIVLDLARMLARMNSLVFKS